jgi:hypothetical protein
MVYDNNNEPWLELCRLAAEEHDPGKLRALITEITRLLAAKQVEREQSFFPHEKRETPDA